MRPCVYIRWCSNIAVIWPSLIVGIDEDDFLCVELCWLGLVLGIGTAKANA